MIKISFASIFGASLLAVSSFANAQGTGVTANSDQGVTPKQCWDVSKNIIREKNSTAAGSMSSEKAPQTTVGSTASSTGSVSTGSSGPDGNASARPSGMPDC
jgi:hypothetical protein